MSLCAWLQVMEFDLSDPWQAADSSVTRCWAGGWLFWEGMTLFFPHFVSYTGGCVPFAWWIDCRSAQKFVWSIIYVLIDTKACRSLGDHISCKQITWVQALLSWDECAALQVLLCVSIKIYLWYCTWRMIGDHINYYISVGAKKWTCPHSSLTASVFFIPKCHFSVLFQHFLRN